MLTRDRFLPSLDIEKLCLPVYLLELEGLSGNPLAFHLATHYRALKSDDSKIMAVCCFNNDKITGLYALTGCIPVYSLARILETDLEIVLELLLIHSCKPVIYLKLATSLTIVAVEFTIGIPLHHTSSGTVISFRFFDVVHTLYIHKHPVDKIAEKYLRVDIPVNHSHDLLNVCNRPHAESLRAFCRHFFIKQVLIL